jgi:molecular chaperone DnaJ
VTCSHCRGHGQLESRQGFFALRTACPQCKGRGKVIKDPCPQCRGRGLTEAPVDVEVPVPVGVETGERIRIRGEGEQGPNGARGDLYCDIVVREHPLFHRNGADLLCELPVTYSTACLGGKVEVPVLGGDTVELDVPAGTQPGEILGLRGRGLPRPQSKSCGNLLVAVMVEVPEKLTHRQKELLRELAEIEGAHVSKKRKSFLDKIKSYVHSMTHASRDEDGKD